MQKLLRCAPLLAVCAIGCAPHPGQGNDAGGNGSGVDMSAGVDFAGSFFDTGDMAGPLVIAPLDQIVMATPAQPMPTLQLSGSVNGVSVAPAWTIDRGEIGSIDVSTGLFTAAGTLAGKANITGTYLGRTATTSVTVKMSQQQNGDPGYPAPAPGPGGYGGVGGGGPAPGASTGQQGVLGGSPTADAAVHILYPYDGTVWPRGLLAPLIAWDQATRKFDAVKITLHEKNFDYTGTFATNNGVNFINIPLPQQVWHTLTYSNGGAGDDITATLVFEDISGATPTAIGPYTLTWHVAPGTLKGTVYYNSYGTALLTNSGEKSCGAASPPTECCINNYLGSGCVVNNSNPPKRSGPEFGAATLAIKPGALDPVVIAGTSTPGSNSGCRVCHSVSSNGKKLITQHGTDYSISSIFDLTAPNPATTDTQVGATGTNHTYPALAPDGSWLMASSGGMINTSAATQAFDNTNVLLAVQPTTPFDTFQAALPTFSPDGKHFAFNYWKSTKGAVNGGDTKSLAVLDYDPLNKVFNNLRTLYTPSDATKASWSSFLPTNDGVVYEHEIAAPSFGFTRYTGKGELMWSTMTNPMPVTLAHANGAGYLPSYGAHTGAADATLNFEPTVNPVVSGGYAWVVFTSRRLYGNVATIDAYKSDPREYDWQHQVTSKKLWVAAIDLNAPAGTDPSHPAFYLPAQELLAGNARGFWTVDPCHPDGTGCETGDECCGGYCRPGGGDGGALICTNQQPSCAQEFEKCTTAADCCGAAQGIMCINGLCSKTQPIP